MISRLAAILLASVCVELACSQSKAPPPKAQDVQVPARPVIPAGGSDQSVVSGTLTAVRAIRIAIARQPTLEAVRQEVIAAEGETRQLRSRLMPQFGVGGAFGTSHFVGDEPDRLDLDLANGYGADALLTQLIFDANHSSDLVKQSEALRTVAQQDLASAEEDLALSVLAAYYLVGEAHQLVEVNEGNVANRESQLSLAKARFTSGIGGPDDVLTAQTEKGNAVIALVQARTIEDSARISLLQILGLDPQTPVRIGTDGAEPVPVDQYDDFVQKALGRRPEVKRAKASISAANYGAQAAKTTTVPVLAGNLNFYTNDPGFPWGGGSYGLGLMLTIPLYDGGLTAGAVQTARAALRSAQADLATTQLQVKTDVSQAYLAVKGAEEQDAAAQVNVVNARESLRIAEGRYKSGLGLFLDIINAQAALLVAETDAATAMAEVYRERAALQRAAGMLAP